MGETRLSYQIAIAINIKEGDANFSRPTVRGWTLSTFDFLRLFIHSTLV